MKEGNVTGQMHFMLGAFTGIAGAKLLYGTGLTAEQSAVFAVCTAAGAMFPDVDLPTSNFGSLIQPFSNVIRALFGHRGLFHTPVLYAIIWGTAKFTGYMCLPLTGFLIGAAGHIIQDLMTKGGVMVLFPLTHKKFCITPFPSGHFINVVSTAGLCYAVWKLLPIFITKAIA